MRCVLREGAKMRRCTLALKTPKDLRTDWEGRCQERACGRLSARQRRVTTQMHPELLGELALVRQRYSRCTFPKALPDVLPDSLRECPCLYSN